MSIPRRTFVAGAAAAAATLTRAASGSSGRRSAAGDDHRGPCAIASGNGLNATARAMELIGDGADPAEAIVAGVAMVERDPNDMSVGYGGLPNERGVVQLDASVMHGPSHKAGSVGALERIKTPAAVALKVLQRTDHVMLVGRGALDFAVAHGFKEEDLLTEKARQAWLRWKETLSDNDDWLHDAREWDAQKGQPVDVNNAEVPFTNGTIHCSAVTGDGDLAGVTTTSGLSYKIPGRVGDSPIIGAGMYVDNAVGAAGATGRGESAIQSCASFNTVREMERGATPTEACLATLRLIDRNTRLKHLLDEQKRPNFNVTLYALRKDGAYGAASMWGERPFAVKDTAGNRTLKTAALYR